MIITQSHMIIAGLIVVAILITYFTNKPKTSNLLQGFSEPLRPLSAMERARLSGLDFLSASRSLGDEQFVVNQATSLGNEWASGIRNVYSGVYAPQAALQAPAVPKAPASSDASPNG